jgi:hypothetical protein
VVPIIIIIIVVVVIIIIINLDLVLLFVLFLVLGCNWPCLAAEDGWLSGLSRRVVL